MVKKKRQSKRLSLKDKYKVEKKVREHHRKSRREERKRAKAGLQPKKKKQNVGLPNLMPFKEQFLRKMLEDKEREQAHEKQRLQMLRERRLAQQEAAMETDQDYADPSMESQSRKRRRAGPDADDLARAVERGQAFEEDQRTKQVEKEEKSTTVDVNAKGKKRMYLKDLRNVVDNSDVVLLVLDARDPMSCRAPQVEKMVLEHARRSKRLVLVLNKIDLVPKTIAERWLTELRKEFPTVAFRASTQQQRNNLSRASKDSIGLGTSSTKHADDRANAIGDRVCVGADTLLQLLKNYSRNKDIKTSITVGVVGFPNVGKSSVINSLKRSRAVGVSPTAGFTKVVQSVQLDKKVKLIDSPGVLFMDSDRNDRLVLRNCLSPGELEDPVSPVQALLAKCNLDQLMMLYNLPRTDTPAAFLAQLASRRGKLNKGGVPDQKSAARMILQDWNSGKIPYFVQPPEQRKSTLSKSSATIVTEWSKEFDMEALLAKEQSELVEHLPGDMDVDDFAVVFENTVSV